LQYGWQHCLILLILLLDNIIPLLLGIEDNLMAGPPGYRPRLELILVYQGLLLVCPALLLMDGVPEEIPLVLLLACDPFYEARLFLEKGPVVVEGVHTEGLLEALVASQLREIP
jgi:hypothetical protein